MSRQPLFFTASTTRKPAFQLETKILSRNNKRHVQKSATQASAQHLQHTVNTYKALSKLTAFKNIRLSKATQKSAVLVEYEFLDGKSLERFAAEGIIAADQQQVLNTITRIMTLIDALPSITTNPSSDAAYTDVFGDVYGAVIECSVVALIDLNLDNFVVLADDSLGFFDYEWCFDFAVPKQFLKLRVLYYLLVRHQNILLYTQHKSPIKRLGDLLIPDYLYIAYEDLFEDFANFLLSEARFQIYVSGSKETFPDIPETVVSDHELEEVGIEALFTRQQERGKEKILQVVEEQKAARKEIAKELRLLKESKSYKLATRISKTKNKLSPRKSR